MWNEPAAGWRTDNGVQKRTSPRRRPARVARARRRGGAGRLYRSRRRLHAGRHHHARRRQDHLRFRPGRPGRHAARARRVGVRGGRAASRAGRGHARGHREGPHLRQGLRAGAVPGGRRGAAGDVPRGPLANEHDDRRPGAVRRDAAGRDRGDCGRGRGGSRSRDRAFQPRERLQRGGRGDRARREDGLRGGTGGRRRWSCGSDRGGVGARRPAARGGGGVPRGSGQGHHLYRRLLSSTSIRRGIWPRTAPAASRRCPSRTCRRARCSESRPSWPSSSA